VASGVHGAGAVMTVEEEGLEGEVRRYANIGKLSLTAPGVARVERYRMKTHYRLSRNNWDGIKDLTLEGEFFFCM